MSILREYELGKALFGTSFQGVAFTPTPGGTSTPAQTDTLYGKVVEASQSGVVSVIIDGDETPIVVYTTVHCEVGDTVILSLHDTLIEVVGVFSGGDREHAIIEDMGELIVEVQDAATAANDVAAAALEEASRAQTAANEAEAAANQAAQDAANAASDAGAAAQAAADAASDAATAQQTANDAAIDAALAKTTADETAAIVETLPDSILSTVSGEYSSKDDTESVRASLQSQIAQNAESITFNFEQTTSQINEVEGILIDDINQRNTYYRFSGTAMIIGQEGSQFKTILDSTHIGFAQNDQEVASISNNSMFIRQAEIQNSISIGSPVNGWFDFVQKANGNLSVKYRG